MQTKGILILYFVPNVTISIYFYIFVKKNNMYSKLTRSFFFKGISEGEIIHILNLTHHQIKTYEPEEIIAFSGDECKNLYLLIEGSIRGEAVDFSGKTIKIEDVFAPETFAEAFLFADENNFLINIVSNTKSKVLIIYKDDLLKLFQKKTKILENFLKITSCRFVLVTKKLKFLSQKTIKGKLTNYLLSLVKKNKGKLTFKLDKTQQQLADYFGITRPSLARIFGEMKDENIISIKQKEITIQDLNKIKELLKNE